MRPARSAAPAPGSSSHVGPRLYLALLWHHHRPLYRDLARTDPRGSPLLPWVRFHTLRNVPMAMRLARHPEIHATINLTRPSSARSRRTSTAPRTARSSSPCGPPKSSPPPNGARSSPPSSTRPDTPRSSPARATASSSTAAAPAGRSPPATSATSRWGSTWPGSAPSSRRTTRCCSPPASPPPSAGSSPASATSSTPTSNGGSTTARPTPPSSHPPAPPRARPRPAPHLRPRTPFPAPLRPPPPPRPGRLQRHPRAHARHPTLTRGPTAAASRPRPSLRVQNDPNPELSFRSATERVTRRPRKLQGHNPLATNPGEGTFIATTPGARPAPPRPHGPRLDPSTRYPIPLAYATR